MASARSDTLCLFVAQATPLGVSTFTNRRALCDLGTRPRIRPSTTTTTTKIPSQPPPPPSPPSCNAGEPVYMVASPADSLGLPPTLRHYVDRFATVPDPKLRYQQLLFLAKELPAMDDALKTEENRVHGCTSVVHVHVVLDDEGRVQLAGDSDSQLTKGLLALLVNGLREAKPHDVAQVDPKFITFSGLAASLTPSRNNGFVNMLAKIKQQVAALSDNAAAEGNAAGEVAVPADEAPDDPQRPVYSAIMRKLRVLKPVALEVEDDSASHAGHAKNIGLNGESHFRVLVVADAFDGVPVVQRHRIVYTLLQEEMSNGWIHALQIDARTPADVK